MVRTVQRLYAQWRRRYREVALAQGEVLVRKLEYRIGQASLVGDRPFFDPAQFPWITSLESHWKDIRAELEPLLERLQSIPNFQDISQDQSSITQDDRWKTYFFYGYGFKAEKNCARCPKTTALIEQIPEMKTAFFSILLPHKQIPEHRGPYKGLLRYHLALKVPHPNQSCGLRVGTEIRHWEEGKSLVFDDTYPHEAWNNTNDIRVVLFVDIVRPMRHPDAWLNRGMIQLIASSPYIKSGKENCLDWEARFETHQPTES